MPNTLATLEIHKQALLNSVTVDNNTWTSLNTLYVDGCPLLDTKTIFKNAPNLNEVKMTDLYWELDPTDSAECTLDGTTITSLPILDRLIRTKGAGNIAAIRDGQLVRNRLYIGGTIKILNGDTYGLDEISLYENYQVYYPNLSFDFVKNEHVTAAYSIDFFDPSDQLLPSYSKRFNMTTVESEATVEAIT